ncbi:MAG TPA: HAD hydrolase-like protein [Anaerolineae bacterium]|nr:HAD hydrolase-like protein [Anaerolineae bacterium]
MYHAVFIDQDGVILGARSDGAEGCEAPQFLPGALDALAQLVASELCVVVMVGQPHTDRRTVPAQMAERAHRYIVEAIGGGEEGRVDYVYWDADCAGERVACREPGAELLRSAARELGVDLSQSYLIGDAALDVRVGRLAGCRDRYLVLTGRGRQELARCWLRGERGFHVAFDLKAAADAILLQEQSAVRQPVTALLRGMASR